MAMAMAMRGAAGKLITARRRRHGSELGFGIAQGYAPLGEIGISERLTVILFPAVARNFLQEQPLRQEKSWKGGWM
jgi:hypothetical protein